MDAGRGDAGQGHQASRAGDYAEDALGFGGAEWRTARDLVVRPHDVLDAYLKFGSTGGGVYARPIRFYVALCGVLMFYLFLVGGTQLYMNQMPPQLLDPIIAGSGKTREAFMDDADKWLSFLMVPMLIPFYAISIAPLIKRWGRTTWRLAFRATFAFLCAWTVPLLVLGPLPYLDDFAVISSALVYLVMIVQFVRMGRGRWWTRRRGAAGKAALLLAVVMIGSLIAMIPLLGIGVLSGLYSS